jgi:hypothetical protein
MRKAATLPYKGIVAACCLLPLLLMDGIHINKSKKCYVETNISLHKFLEHASALGIRPKSHKQLSFFSRTMQESCMSFQ